MASLHPEQNGSPTHDDEEFQKHLKQMLSTSPGGNSQSINGQTMGEMSSVDLAAPGSNAGKYQAHDENESPFKPPELPSSMSGPGPSIGAGLSDGGAYPRPVAPQAQGSKVDLVKAQVKEFTVETFRTTKQLINEMLGKGTRTVDPQLDTSIHELKLLQAAYMKLIEQVANLHNYFSNVIYTQKQMTNLMGELAQRDPKLSEDFSCNAETQRILIRSGEQLLGALLFFMSNMRTLCTKTMQDCLETVKKYESARLQYDTYRSEHEQAIHSGSPTSVKTAEIREKYEERKRRYEQYKADLAVKLQFLEENKNKVVHRQMVLFHNAISAYFSGNQEQLQSVINQFSIKIKSPNSESSSWLEK